MPDAQGFLTDDEIAELPPVHKALAGLARKQQSLLIALGAATDVAMRQDIKLRLKQVDARILFVSEQPVFSVPTDGQLMDIRNATKNLVALNAARAQAELLFGAAVEIFELPLGARNWRIDAKPPCVPTRLRIRLCGPRARDPSSLPVPALVWRLVRQWCFFAIVSRTKLLGGSGELTAKARECEMLVADLLRGAGHSGD